MKPEVPVEANAEGLARRLLTICRDESIPPDAMIYACLIVAATLGHRGRMGRSVWRRLIMRAWDGGKRLADGLAKAEREERRAALEFRSSQLRASLEETP